MSGRQAIDLVRALMASSVLFIPSSAPYRETMMEGVYSLSQLLGLVNHSFFNRDLRNNQPLLQTLSLITSVLSNVEVFLEGVSHVFCGTAQQNLLVLVIEATKAACRMVTLLASPSKTMLLNWGKNEGTTAVPDLLSYIAHYQSASARLLSNLHAKRPNLFTLTRTPSFRLHALPGMGAGALAGSPARSPVQEPPAPVVGKRSGIQLNSSAFDVIPIKQSPVKSGAPVSFADATSPASTGTTTSAHSAESLRDHHHDINGETPAGDDAEITPYHPGIPYEGLLRGSAKSYAHSLSGRSSPEYKDNEPGSIYAPTASIPPLNVHENGTPYNKGYQLHAHFADTHGSVGASSGAPSEPGSAYSDGGSDSVANTPYAPFAGITASIYAHSENNTPAGTPYRKPQYFGGTGTSATPGYGYNSNVSSATKYRLEFDPEGEECVGPPFNSADTSFDCEMVFTSIYSQSPQTIKAIESGEQKGPQDPAVVADIDAFEGENKHFKSNLLESKGGKLAADAAWAGEKRKGFLFENDPGEEESGRSTPARPGSRAGAGAGGGMSGMLGGGSWSAAFELSAEDALKLGEMLYILRPLIYAALVHQVEISGSQRAPPATTTPSSAAVSGGSSGASVGGAAFRAVGAAVNDAFARVMDNFTMDALLNVVALAVSFVTELLSIQLTQYALLSVRSKTRDDTFSTHIPQYLILGASPTIGTQDAAAEGIPGRGHMPQYAVLRKRVYDAYAQEHRKMVNKHAFDQELNRRKMTLFLYLIRSPIFDRATYPLLKSVSGAMQGIPLLGSLPEYALSALSYLNKMHFYNANS